jgi:hypothetical protein
VDLVSDRVDPRPLELGLNSMSEKGVARGVSDVHDALLGVARRLDHRHIAGRDDLVDEGEVLGREVGKAGNVDLVDDEEGGLVGEEGLDRVEKLALRE